MKEINGFLSMQVLNNPLRDWIYAVVIFLVTFTVLPLLKSYLERLMKRYPAENQSTAVKLILRLIPRTSQIVVWVVALNAAERFLDFSRNVERGLHFLIQVGLWFQIGLWGMTIIEYYLEHQHRARLNRDPGFASSLGIINFIARFMIWALVSLLALDNLGVNITTLVAGLGVGGIAVALAVQTLLGDLLASLSITLDKPFAVGDNLTLDDIQGKVEHIGVRSTRLRSVGGEQIIISNADLVKSRVRNFGRMDERRGMLAIGVTYETPREKVQRVAAIIEQSIRAQRNVRLERCHFKEFGPSSLNFEAVFFVLEPKLDALMDAQHAINFRILEAFERESIEFAYPTQKLFLSRA